MRERRDVASDDMQAGRRSGALLAVVGPSGVGKDTLIDGARARLAADPGFVFARRAITRPSAAIGEQHEPMSDEEFAAAAAAGAFFAQWRAHGARYGAPASIAEALRAGRSVVLNGSRSALADTAARAAAVGAPTAAIHVDASPQIVAERLHRRGRESAGEILARRARPGLAEVEGVPVIEVLNDGSVEEGVERLVTALYAGARLAAAPQAAAARRQVR